MLQAFAKTLRERCRVEPGMSLLVAVSGGADSVALLHLLKNLPAEWGLELRAAHLDHALRKESDAEASWVAGLCAHLDIPLVRERVEVAALARSRGEGLEAAARFARYRFLRQQAAACGCHHIALGHHRGDQAETILLRLLRGSGTAGLGGMAWRRGDLIRPLLDLRREDLQAYLVGIGQGWLSDPSNRDPDFTRNRIRHHLLPHLADFNPKIERSLARLAAQLAVDEEFWAERVATEFAVLARSSAGSLTLPVARLTSLHPALRTRLHRRLLQEVRGDLQGITAAHIDALDALVTGARSQAAIDLPGAWAARRYADLVVRQAAPQPPVAVHCRIDGPGDYPLPGGKVLKVRCDVRPAGEGPTQVEYRLAGTGFPLVVRSVRPGDRFRPSGMQGSKKLKDYFIDAKLTFEERAAALVVEGDEILWLVGRRRCAGHRADEGTGEVVRITLEGTENGQTAC